MAKRKTMFGVPIGKKKSNLAPTVVASAGALVPAAMAAARLVSASRSGSGNGSSSGPLDKLGEAASSLRKASDLADKVGKVAGAASQHSSTIGQAGAVIKQIAKFGNGPSAPRLSHLIEEHTEIAVPRSVAYNQWTQFEMFPSIVKGAERVQQKRRDTVQWTSKIGPSRRTWEGEITEQVPDERIAWKSKGGLNLKGVVTFHSLDDELTRVLVEMEYDPSGAVEHVGNLLRVQRRRVRRDLRLFKHFVELRGEETGGWRNRIAKKGGSDQS